ncbi:MAG: zinc metalloprotease [Actinomycetota bacterium]|nr:zinc metalloprotease [Actinomycetota bacterium]
MAKGDPGACDRTYANSRLAEGSDLKAEPTAMSAREQRSYEKTLNRRLHKMGYNNKAAAARGGGNNNIRIDVFMHVLRKNNGDGNVSDKQIRRQIKVMNRAFAGRTDNDAASTRFRFRLKDTDRTKKTDWYKWRFKDDDRVAKKKLRRGTFEDLNVYIANLSGGLLGYAFYPNLPKKKLYRDGLVILNESLPGGRAKPYHRGDTATHELGHWLGLYHTFQNSCGRLGDRVEDTPRQEADVNVFECDESLNTCGRGTRRPDPVHNFMNYTDDKCINQFTRGQDDRMKLSWLAYRKGR